MALGLAGDDQGVVFEQMVEQLPVRLRDGVPVGVFEDFGPQHRVVLGQRIQSLGLETGLGRPRDGVEEDGFLDGRHHRVPGAPEHGVIGPDDEHVLSLGLQPAAVVERVAGEFLYVEAGSRGRVGIDPVAARFEVAGGDLRVRGGWIPVPVEEEVGVEDLDRRVGIQRQDDLADPAQVPVEELAEAPGVLYRAQSRPAGDEEFAPRQAEGVLAVHEQEPHARRVAGRRLETVLPGPGAGFGGPGLVGDPVELTDALGIEEIGNRKRFWHGSETGRFTPGTVGLG